MSTISNLPHPRATTDGLNARVDRIDALIWAAARETDDPQLTVGRAREYSQGVFVGLVVGAGSGRHRLNCSVPTATGPISAGEDLHFEVAAEIPAVSLPASGAEREVCGLFALAHASGVEATAILRSRPSAGPPDLLDSAALPGSQGLPSSPGSAANVESPRGFTGASAEGYVVRGWRLADGGTAPIDAAGMFAFCCSEASSGEPLPLDPNTRYADARALVKPPD